MSRDVVSDAPRRRIALPTHQRHLLTGLPPAQTGLFRGASSQQVSPIADNPSGPLQSTEDGRSYSRVFAEGRRSRAGAAGVQASSASRLRQSERGYDGRRRAGNSGVTTTEIIRRLSVQESSRLWPTSPGRGPDAAGKSYSGQVQNHVGYLGNLQQTQERDYSGYKEAGKLAAMKPYGEMKKSRFLGSGSPTAPPGPPMEMDRMSSRSQKTQRGQSYLFKHSQNPAVTGKPVASAVGISRDQRVGSAETQTPAHPTKGMEDKYAASSQSSGGSTSTHVSKPAQSPKRLYGFRGFEHPTRSRPKENWGQHGFSKGRFTLSNVYPALLAKYSFSQRDAETQEGVQRDSARPLTPGSKESRLRVPGRINERNPDQRTFSTSRISRLPGFDAPTLEGAKPLIHKSDKPVKVQPGFRGFFLGNSQIWRPERSQMHRWYNRSGPGSGDVTATGELQREGLKMHSKTSGSAEAGITPDIYRENHHATTPVNSRISPANLGTTGGQTEPGPGPRPPSKPHRSKLRDAAHVMVSRPPEQPARLESFTYTDVLGNASFSSVSTNVQSCDPANRKVRIRSEDGGEGRQ